MTAKTAHPYSIAQKEGHEFLAEKYTPSKN